MNPSTPPMQNKVQLITYVDRLSGGGIVDLAALLRGPLSGLFGGIHLLPFFVSDPARYLVIGKMTTYTDRETPP